ncbi:hypothetical protein ACFL9T_21515 [Thermodesulfobacteriota bacterium]
MARALMVVLTRCNDLKRLDEFNEWYSFHHMPDVLETEGFSKASRYRLIGTLEAAGGEKPGEFLALYEADTDDPAALNKAVMEKMQEKGAKGRILQHETCDVISTGFYSFINEASQEE